MHSNRDFQTINGNAIGTYAAQNGMLIVITADLATRLMATTPSKNQAWSTFSWIDSVGSTRLFAGSTSSGELVTTGQGFAAKCMVVQNTDRTQGYMGTIVL